MRLEIWSDLMCPWCYLGHLRLRTALSRFAHREQVLTVWRAFELRPGQPGLPGRTLAEMMATDYGLDAARVATLFRHIEELGAREGAGIVLSDLRPVNSFDAHRLVHLAARRGLATRTKDRLFRAYFTEHRNIADHAVLSAVAEDVGLDGAAAAAVLAGDGFADAVREDERLAATAGFRAVPAFRIDGTAGIDGASGTPSADRLTAALETAWNERTEVG
ncbi:DsbA family oxidoreductase [Streptomyces sp. NPDC005435]|uniref:DsbA family oxidoreductase n=1 Tax=Streptomyces sp. NPDC005435 TaxID=3154464 RepID=UPI00345193AD